VIWDDFRHTNPEMLPAPLPFAMVFRIVPSYWFFR